MGCFNSTNKTIQSNALNKTPNRTIKKIVEEKEILSQSQKEKEEISEPMISDNIKIKNLIIKNDEKVEDNYRILAKLGKGSFGSVFKVMHITSGIIRAMKVIKKDSLTYQDDDQKFLKEIEILIEAEHPNIIRIFEYYFDDINFYLITEFVSGGELYDTITSWKSFDEDKAGYIMAQILSAVNYLHKKGIVHRDIKPENMLVENKIKIGKEKKEMINIKLIDFGTCNYMSDKNFTLKVGSPYYIAPEVLRRNYNEKCDIWSCGVILYILLVGYPPFSGVNTNELLSNVARGDYSMKGSEWKSISSSAKDLLTQMLQVDHNKRISAENALEHPWVKNVENKKYNNVDPKFFEEVLKNIAEFNAREKLQQATIAYIVHFVYNSQEIEELKKVFKKLDQNGDGQLTYLELKNGLEYFFGKYKSDADMDEIIQEIDGDNDGWISYEEFLRVSIKLDKLLDEHNLKMAFDKFDLDKDGRLSKEEIKKVLGTTENEYINLLIHYIDSNKDGYINFEEFKNLMNGVVSKDVSNLTKRRSSILKDRRSSEIVNSGILKKPGSSPRRSNNYFPEGTGISPDSRFNDSQNNKVSNLKSMPSIENNKKTLTDMKKVNQTIKLQYNEDDEFSSSGSSVREKSPTNKV